MELHKKSMFIVVLILSISIFLSQNFWTAGPSVAEPFDWSMYYTALSGTVFVSWQDSFFGQLLPFLAYFPAIAGIMGILSAFFLVGNEIALKIALKITGIFAILAYVTFFLFGLLFGIFSSETQIPNLPGGYLCLVPGIILFILSMLIQKPEYMKGHAPENKEYYAIETTETPSTPAYQVGMIQCPNCGTMIPADAQFCENCGQFL
ncbi:MAG: zinc ribbon domain-containing protein [Candidatus Helarchaeota archaeon]